LNFKDYQYSITVYQNTTEDAPPCSSCNEVDFIKCRDGERDSRKCKAFNCWTDAESKYRKVYRQGLREKTNA